MVQEYNEKDIERKNIMLKIGKIVMGSVQTNCYFLYKEDDLPCYIYVVMVQNLG